MLTTFVALACAPALALFLPFGWSAPSGSGRATAMPLGSNRLVAALIFGAVTPLSGAPAENRHA